MPETLSDLLLAFSDLRGSLNQAERWGLVQRNVAELASAPSQPQREQHPRDAVAMPACLSPPWPHDWDTPTAPRR